VHPDEFAELLHRSQLAAVRAVDRKSVDGHHILARLALHSPPGLFDFTLLRQPPATRGSPRLELDADPRPSRGRSALPPERVAEHLVEHARGVLLRGCCGCCHQPRVLLRGEVPQICGVPAVRAVER
jgi:hypothetical protein